MKQIFLYLFTIGAAFVLNSCGGLYFTTDHNPDIDFNRYKTYNICQADMAIENPKYPEYDNNFNRELIKEAVEEEMNNIGYQKNESDPQLQAGFKFVIANEIVSLINCYDDSEFGYGPVCTLEELKYKEETLMVYVSDLKTNEVIWHAIISKELNDSPEKLKKKIRKKIAQLFKKYPIS